MTALLSTTQSILALAIHLCALTFPVPPLPQVKNIFTAFPSPRAFGLLFIQTSSVYLLTYGPSPVLVFGHSS